MNHSSKYQSWFSDASACTHAAAVWLPLGCTAAEELDLLREFALELCERAGFLCHKGSYMNVISFKAARHTGSDGPKWLLAGNEVADSFVPGDWAWRVKRSWARLAEGQAAAAVQGRRELRTLIDKMQADCRHLSEFTTHLDIGLPEVGVRVHASVPGPRRMRIDPVVFDIDALGTPFFDCGLIPRWADRRVWICDELIDGAVLAFYTFAPPGGVLFAEYLYFDNDGRLYLSPQPMRAWSGATNLRSEIGRLLNRQARVHGVLGTEGMTFSSSDALCDMLFNMDAGPQIRWTAAASH